MAPNHPNFFFFVSVVNLLRREVVNLERRKVVSLNQRRVVSLTGASNIPSIAINNRIYPVAMTVYDLDGMEGIYVPQRAGGKAISESMGNSLQSMPLLTLDPSLKAQAATAGAQAIKSMVGKRSRQIKVSLPAGYQVILQSSK